MAESPHARFERFAPEERLFHVDSLPEALMLPPTLLRMATTELGTDWRREWVYCRLSFNRDRLYRPYSKYI